MLQLFVFRVSSLEGYSTCSELEQSSTSAMRPPPRSSCGSPVASERPLEPLCGPCPLTPAPGGHWSATCHCSVASGRAQSTGRGGGAVIRRAAVCVRLVPRGAVPLSSAVRCCPRPQAVAFSRCLGDREPADTAGLSAPPGWAPELSPVRRIRNKAAVSLGADVRLVFLSC